MQSPDTNARETEVHELQNKVFKIFTYSHRNYEKESKKNFGTKE